MSLVCGTCAWVIAKTIKLLWTGITLSPVGLQQGNELASHIEFKGKAIITPRAHHHPIPTPIPHTTPPISPWGDNATRYPNKNWGWGCGSLQSAQSHCTSIDHISLTQFPDNTSVVCTGRLALGNVCYAKETNHKDKLEDVI